MTKEKLYKHKKQQIKKHSKKPSEYVV